MSYMCLRIMLRKILELKRVKKRGHYTALHNEELCTICRFPSKELSSITGPVQ
jgi:hypothetical protein